MAKETKFRFMTLQACRNGWEVYTGSLGELRSRDDVFVFETWESLTNWLRENLQDKE